MELALGIIGGVFFVTLVFGTLGLSSLFKRTNNKQKKAELAKARRQVKVYPGYDKFTDVLLSAKGKVTAECVNDQKTIKLYFELLDRDGRKKVEPCTYKADDIIDYIEIKTN